MWVLKESLEKGGSWSSLKSIKTWVVETQQKEMKVACRNELVEKLFVRRFYNFRTVFNFCSLAIVRVVAVLVCYSHRQILQKWLSKAEVSFAPMKSETNEARRGDFDQLN